MPPRIDEPPAGDDQQPIIDDDFTYTVGSRAIGVTGRRLVLKCRDGSGRPPSSITWTLPSGQELNAGQSIRQPPVLVTDDGSLAITSASSDNDGSYTCRAENVAGVDMETSTVSIYCELVIGAIILSLQCMLVIARPVITVPPEDNVEFNGNPASSPLEPTEGDDVSFRCEATATPQPAIVWYKDGVRISQTGRVVVSDSGTLLTVRNFRVSDIGIYSCYADNAAGDTASAVGVEGVGNRGKFICV